LIYLLSEVVLHFEVLERDADLLVLGGKKVIDARRVVGILARMARRVERAVDRRRATVDKVTAIAIARHRRRPRNRVVCSHRRESDNDNGKV